MIAPNRLVRFIAISVVAFLILAHASICAQDYNVRVRRPERIVVDLLPSIQGVRVVPRTNGASLRVPDSIDIVVTLDDTKPSPYDISLIVPHRAGYWLRGDLARQKLSKKLRKALQWCEKSRTNKLNAEKELFSDNSSIASIVTGTFFARQDGADCGLQLSYVTARSLCMIEIPETGIRRMLALLNKVPSLLSKLRAEQKKARKADAILR